MADLVERMLERPRGLVRGLRDRDLDPGRLGMNRDRLMAGGPRLQADALVGIAALVAVHVLDMELEVVFVPQGDVVLPKFTPIGGSR